METLQLDLNKRYTYADYLTWFDDISRELIDGFVKLMSPAPRLIHQRISRKITLKLGKFLENRSCEMFYAPADVRLPKNGEKYDKEIYTVVQPDLFVVCDVSKLDDKGCLGAPDFIIEIVSQGNSKHDVDTKFKLYEKHGVREYWIVHPHDQTVNVFVLDNNGKYQFGGLYAKGSTVKVNIFDDLFIDLEEVFED